MDKDEVVLLELCEAYRDKESKTERKENCKKQTDKISQNVLEHRYFLTPMEHREKMNVIFSIYTASSP